MTPYYEQDVPREKEEATPDVLAAYEEVVRTATVLEDKLWPKFKSVEKERGDLATALSRLNALKGTP